jgi:hypothetical protein
LLAGFPMPIGSDPAGWLEKSRVFSDRL